MAAKAGDLVESPVNREDSHRVLREVVSAARGDEGPVRRKRHAHGPEFAGRKAAKRGGLMLKGAQK